MNTSKFFQNQRNSLHHSNHLIYTTAELYPRMRRTELYHEPAIPEEYQVRDFEHPRSRDSSDSSNRRKADKIVPPNNSETRLLRDSYFS